MSSGLARMKLLRVEASFLYVRYRFFCSMSAGKSVAQILQSEFGSFQDDVSKPSAEPRCRQMLEKPAIRPMKSSELGVKKEQAHLHALEFEQQYDRPHKLETAHESKIQQGRDNLHDTGLEGKSGHAISQLHSPDSKHVFDHTPPYKFDVAEQQSPSKKSSQDIIKLLIDRVNSQSWIALEKDVQNFKIEITPKEVAWVLKVLKNPSRAWELFKAASRWPGYAHDSICYSTMVDLLGKSSDHSLLNDLLVEMEERKVHLTLATINQLIGIFATSDEIHKAEHYFLKLNQLSIQPSPYTYKCMLQAFAKAGKCEKALEMYRVMQSDQQPITVISYNILMDALSKNGKADLALKIYEEMKGSGHLSDVYTYTILARTYGHMGMVGKALDLLEEMKQNGVEPNKHTYNTILDALPGTPEGLENAIKLFKRMAMEGVYPNASSCQSILNLLCKGRQVGRSLELVQCIKDKSVRKEVCEYFIKVLGKMGHLRDVCLLFQDLKVSNVGLSRATCLSVIDALCRGGEARRAMSVMEEAEAKSGLVPLTTYNTILSGLRNGNQFQVAHDLFKRMKERGPLPDVIAYNIILAGLTKMKNLPLAETLFEEMMRSGCMPNVVTFNTMLHSFARAGDVISTRRLLQAMYAKEVTPDIVSYNCAIECFERAGKPKVVLKIFKEMKEKGCSPSFVTFNSVLRALANAGMAEDGLALFEQMKEQGCVPDAMTFMTLGRIYNSSAQLDKNQLKEEIRKAGLAHELFV